MDSLVDACSFGLAPTALLYAIGLNQWFDLALLGFFLCCAVWRLAYFDTVGMETTRFGPLLHRPAHHVCRSRPAAGFSDGIGGHVLAAHGLRVATLVLALAMVSPLRCRKPGLLVYAFFLLLAIGVASLLIWQAPQIHRQLRL